MKGLLLKDYSLYLHLYGKSLILMLLLFTVMGIFSPGFNVVIGWLLPFYGIFLLQTEQSCNWDLYACSLPVSRAQIVSARFIFVLALMGMGAIVSLFSGALGVLFSSMLPDEVVAGTFGGILPFLPLGGLTLFFNYRFGPSKSRILLAVICLLPMAILLISNFAGDGQGMRGFMNWIDQNVLLAALAFASICIFFFALFWVLSIRFCKKMDF